MEVINDCGCFFDRKRKLDSLREKLQELVDSPEAVTYFRGKVRSRIEQYYNWEWITEFYEDLFVRLISKETLISYDEYLIKTGGFQRITD
jgi:glycosyltransferase involved in cell wall biosynthesis